jgi:hypothetical protein
MVEYHVVQTPSPYDPDGNRAPLSHDENYPQFAREVESYLNDGWKLAGGVAYVDFHGGCFAQAVYRDSDWGS